MPSSLHQMNPPEKCPHCGAEEANSHSEYWEGEDWVCGSIHEGTQSNLCREREKRQKAEEELKTLREMRTFREKTTGQPICCTCGMTVGVVSNTKLLEDNQQLAELLERAFKLVEYVWLEDASPTEALAELLERAFKLVEYVWLEDASPTEALAELQEKLNKLTK